MIHPKEFQIREVAAASSSRTAAETSSNSDNVLSSLFRARMQTAPLSSTNHDEDKPQQRVAPLVSSMAGANPSIFPVESSLPKAASSSGHLPSTSLFHQLGQNRPFQSVVNNNRSVPFPMHSELFTTAAPFPTSPLSINTHPSSGQEELDQSLRSLSDALMISRRATASMTSSSVSAPFNGNHSNKRRPLRNQATRMRLVGQVLGQKGVQKLLSVVKELKNLPQESSILVDAWENTPLNDLKALPWEDMLRDAQLRLEAHK